MHPEVTRPMAKFLKYTLVGALGTLCHYLWLTMLTAVYPGRAASFAATGALIGAMVNYSLNYTYTFSSLKPHSETLPRFMMLALFNMVVSSYCVVCAEYAGMHYLVGQVAASAFCLGFGFLASWKVVFNEERSLDCRSCL